MVNTIRLVSWNIDFQAEMSEVERFLCGLEFNVLCLQEVTTGPRSTSASANVWTTDSLAMLRAAFPRHTIHYYPGQTWQDGRSFGNALILSPDVTCLDSGVVTLRDELAEPDSYIIGRCIAWTRLQIGSETLVVATTHLSFAPNLTIDHARQDEFRRLEEWVRTQTEPLILTGDFNARPDSPEMTHLGQLLEDAGRFAGGTWPARDFTYAGYTVQGDAIAPPLRIDYVFADRSLAVTASTLPAAGNISDHHPVSVIQSPR